MLIRPFVLGAAVLLGACGGGGTLESREGSSTCADVSTRGSIVVLAASSMAHVFAETQKQFLDAHPCVTEVTFSYGSSAALATQIVNGSPADVFVSASKATMNVVLDADVASSSQVFAKNRAAILVSNSSKFSDSLRSLKDLGDDVNLGIVVGVCVASAPCGEIADAVLNKAGLQRGVIADTETPSAEDLVTKIELGELDAGIVFNSDCQHAIFGNKTSCVSIPMEENATTEYFVATLNNRVIAREFFGYINGSDFKAALQQKFGFLAP